MKIKSPLCNDIMCFIVIVYYINSNKYNKQLNQQQNKIE